MKSKVEISKLLVLKGSVSGLMARFVNIGLLLWFNQYLIRRISPEEYSLYPLVMALMSFLMIIKGALDGSNTRFITEAYARGDDEAVTRISSTMFAYSLITSFFLIIGGSLFCWKINHIFVVAPHFVLDIRIMTAIIFLSLVISMLVSPFQAGITTKQKFVAKNSIEVLVEIFRLIMLSVLIFGVSTQVLWVVVATESAKILGEMIRLIISLKLIPAQRFSLSHIDFKQGRQLLSFGGWNFVGGVMFRIRSSVDPIILNQLATSFDVTCFHIGTLFTRQITRARILATDALIPSLIAMFATNQIERLRNTFLKFGRIIIWSYMVIALPLVIYASNFIQLYVGNKFLAAVPVIILVMANEIPYLGISMVYNLSQAQGQVKSYTLRSTIIQIFNLGLTLYLVGSLRMGAFGAALGTLISGAILRPALMIPLGLRLAGLDMRTWLTQTVIPGFIPSIAGTAVWVTLKLIYPPDSWLELIVFGAVGALVYLLFLLGFSLQPDDRKDIKKLFPFLPVRK